MKVELKNVRKDTVSCNFCSGTLSEKGDGLTYKYENVVEFQRDASQGLAAFICDSCLQELYVKGCAMFDRAKKIKKLPVPDGWEVDDDREPAPGDAVLIVDGDSHNIPVWAIATISKINSALPLYPYDVNYKGIGQYLRRDQFVIVKPTITHIKTTAV